MINTFASCDHPFNIGQPLYLKNSTDQRAYIAVGFHWGTFGDWFVTTVLETDPEGPSYVDAVDLFQDHPNIIHAKFTGRWRETKNGCAMLREIEGGQI